MNKYRELRVGELFEFPGIEPHEVVGYIPGGNNRVILRARCHNGDDVVLKIAQAHEHHADQFRGMCEKIHDYQQMLRTLGVPTPHPITTHETVMDGRRFLLETSPFTGQSVHELILLASPAEVIALSHEMIDNALSLIFSQNLRADGNLKCGADMLPRNFTKDEKGMCYVDLWPPKLWLNGEPTLEYPEPLEPRVVELGVFRHFTIKGISQVFLVQLCRVRPELRREFQALADGFLEKMGFQEQLTWMRQRPALLLQNGEILERVLEPLDYLRIYDLREVACELAFQRKITSYQLEWVFKVSHFQDNPLPEEIIEIIKKELLR